MNTWLVFATVHTLRGQPVDQAAASELQTRLITMTRHSSEPGIEPQVTLHEGSAQIRQSFPMVDAFQAVSLARQSLLRRTNPDDIVEIQAVRLKDWQASHPS